MTDAEHVTIPEAARRYRVSDKKRERAIRAEKLRARYPKPNRCEIAVSDLERFLSGQVSGQSMEPLESRVAELEQRVADREDLVQRELSRQEGSKPRQASPAKEHTTGPLPKQCISLLVFAGLHNVAEAKVLAHMDTGRLPVKRGEWTNKDGSVVTLALDPAGKRAFHQIYHGVPPFFECSQCPHETTWTVSRQRKHNRSEQVTDTRGRQGGLLCWSHQTVPTSFLCRPGLVAVLLSVCRLPCPLRVPSRAG